MRPLRSQACCVLIFVLGCAADPVDSSPAEPDAQPDGGGSAGSAGSAGADASAAGDAGPDTAAPADCANPLDFGAIGDGVADDTVAFQSAADAKKPLCVVAPPVRYRITSGIRIYASISGDGSMPEIWLDQPSGQWDDSMLQVVDHSGGSLTISGLHLDGGWTGATNGEWSSGVHISGSHDVTVEKMLIENLYGDGVYVGGGSFSSAQSKNISIRDSQIDNPRRCNIAVIHVDGLAITNNDFSKDNTYVADIDIEPNPNDVDNVWNIVIDGNTFTSPNENAVSLYHNSAWPDPAGGLGGNIEIKNNSGDTAAGVNITGDEWVNVTQTNNQWW